MTKLEELTKELNIAKQEELSCKQSYILKKRELMHVETRLVEAKTATIYATEQLENFISNHIGETSLDDHRVWQIEDYKTRMPELMKKIENEPMLKRLGILDLETKKNPNETK